jgi:(p)ppGpp synthase/HD superfamily hydrolase
MGTDITKEKISVQKVIKAKKFAEKIHGDQMYGDHPYTYHLNMVSEIVSPFGEEARILGHLHDILEDTMVSEEEIQKEFGDRILKLVCLVSDCAGKNRKEKKLETNKKLSKIEEEDFVVLIVKVGDRTANVVNCILEKNKSLFNMYKKEHTEFKKAVYRPQICEALWAELDNAINIKVGED